MIFKKIRSLVGRLFSENQQMIIILWLSQIFWNLRKYFLGVEIIYPPEFLNNWKEIKKKSSQDKERNFTVYQLVKLHNKLFSGKQTNIIEFGTDRGGALTTIAKFIKENSNIYSVDSFGFHANEIKKNVSKYDEHYHGRYLPFTIKTRFKNFSHLEMTETINKILQSTIDTFNFIKTRLEKNAIILFDDYNLINQEGVKKAVEDLKIDLDKGIQTQSGQLILFN
jgi:hypothetical protein